MVAIEAIFFDSEADTVCRETTMHGAAHGGRWLCPRCCADKPRVTDLALIACDTFGLTLCHQCHDARLAAAGLSSTSRGHHCEFTDSEDLEESEEDRALAIMEELRLNDDVAEAERRYYESDVSESDGDSAA